MRLWLSKHVRLLDSRYFYFWVGGLLERGALTDFAELAKLAQAYLDARVNKGQHHTIAKQEDKQNTQNKGSKLRLILHKGLLRWACFKCNKPRQLAKDCFKFKKTAAISHNWIGQRNLQNKRQVALHFIKQVKDNASQLTKKGEKTKRREANDISCPSNVRCKA